ncbi:GDP-fucose protein O-fucosyltransferase 2-like protein, partial [Dinothrombium tinctorium]
NWTLVLPPFGPLYHWKSRRFQRSKLPWTLFFDIQSLNAIVPVIEFEQFLSEIGDQIDIVVALKHFDDNFDDRWYERFEIEYCEESKSYYKLSENEVRGWFFSYFDRVTASNLICLKIEGFTTTLKKFIRKQLSNYFSVFISNAEVILHKNYGDSLYWSIRRSMRFNRDLIAIGDEFRAKYLNSTNIQDKTTIESDWVHMRRNHGDALGGPFLAVHIRRDDFAKSRPKDVPTLDCAKEQIFFVAKKFSLELVFIASDMREEEWIQLTKGLFENYNLKVFRFKNDTLLDGQVAIVDQWICAHARVFIDTHGNKSKDGKEKPSSHKTRVLTLKT